ARPVPAALLSLEIIRIMIQELRQQIERSVGKDLAACSSIEREALQTRDALVILHLGLQDINNALDRDTLIRKFFADRLEPIRQSDLVYLQSTSAIGNKISVTFAKFLAPILRINYVALLIPTLHIPQEFDAQLVSADGITTLYNNL